RPAGSPPLRARAAPRACGARRAARRTRSGSGLDDLAAPDVAGRAARDGVVPAPDHVRRGLVIVAFEHAHRLADVAVRQLELERHALAEVLRRHEALALHEPYDIGTVTQGEHAR